jgi:hypothetical protein
MTKRIIGQVATLVLAGALAGCGDTVTAKDCQASCQDVDDSCVQKCTDDTCKTSCAADLDHCKASCDTITVSPPDGGTVK